MQLIMNAKDLARVEGALAPFLSKDESRPHLMRATWYWVRSNQAVVVATSGLVLARVVMDVDCPDLRATPSPAPMVEVSRVVDVRGLVTLTLEYPGVDRGGRITLNDIDELYPPQINASKVVRRESPAVMNFDPKLLGVLYTAARKLRGDGEVLTQWPATERDPVRVDFAMRGGNEVVFIAMPKRF